MASTRCTVVFSRRSTCWPTAVVNALLMSVSCRLSMAGPRSITVILLPSELKTWPISAAMNPPPRIAMAPGSSGSRITLSEVR